MSFRFRDPKIQSCENDADSYKKGAHFTGICKNQIGLVFLNRHFEPISWPQILEIHYPPPMFAERQQDPRLIYVGNRLMMVYSNMTTGGDIPGIRRMFVVEIFYENEKFSASEPIWLDRYEGQDEQKWVKNWVPFDHNNKLHLAHTINPHHIFRYNATSACETVAKTSVNLDWDYGTLRGGTPAILDNGEYLAFFHSSKEMKTAHSEGKKIQHYFMGAYTFSAGPPFALTAISKVPIIGKNFLHGPVHQTWKPLRVVFPGGLIVGQEKVWVAYGRQDHEVWIATMDKSRLLKSLVSINSSECH